MTADGIGPGNRDIFALLSDLAHAGRVLAPVDPGSAEGLGEAPAADAGGYRVVAHGSGKAPASRPVASTFVDALASRGLIEACAQGYALSEAGKSWLLRHLAGQDAFAAQHQHRGERMIELGGAKRPALVNESESPLAWLASRKDKEGKPLLAPHLFEAGERLRADYERACLMPRVTANWSATASVSPSRRGAPRDPAEFSDYVLAARERVGRALDAVGPELSGILIDVCCHLKGLEEAERCEGWPKRSGKVILTIALTRLARHYGLLAEAIGPAGGRGRVLHWGSADYRPRLDAES